MAILILLDTDGPVIHLEDQAVVSDLAGLVLLEAVLAGSGADAAGVADRYGADPAALGALARLLADVGPVDELPVPHEPVPVPSVRPSRSPTTTLTC